MRFCCERITEAPLLKATHLYSSSVEVNVVSRVFRIPRTVAESLKNISGEWILNAEKVPTSHEIIVFFLFPKLENDLSCF